MERKLARWAGESVCVFVWWWWGAGARAERCLGNGRARAHLVAHREPAEPHEGGGVLAAVGGVGEREEEELGDDARGGERVADALAHRVHREEVELQVHRDDERHRLPRRLRKRERDEHPKVEREAAERDARPQPERQPLGPHAHEVGPRHAAVDRVLLEAEEDAADDPPLEPVDVQLPPRREAVDDGALQPQHHQEAAAPRERRAKVVAHRRQQLIASCFAVWMQSYRDREAQALSRAHAHFEQQLQRVRQRQTLLRLQRE